MTINVQKFQFDAIFEPEHIAFHDPIYSQTQMDHALAQQHQESFEAGRTHAQNDIDAMNTIHLENIHQTITGVLTVHQQTYETLHGHVSQICRIMVEKMLPTLMEKGALEEVLNVIHLAFQEYDQSSHVKISVGHSYGEPLKKKIQEQLKGEHFPEFIILEEEHLGPSDCRVEWQTGGVERLVAHIHNQIACALDRLTAVADYRKEELGMVLAADSQKQNTEEVNEEEAER